MRTDGESEVGEGGAPREGVGLDLIGSLASRMSSGDREAAAVFVREYGPRIRRRVRSKLSRGLRVFFDSFDLLGTVARRLDRAVSDHELRGTTAGQLWSYVNCITDRAIIDRTRLVDRLRRTEQEDRDIANLLRERVTRLDDSGEDREQMEAELRDAVEGIADPLDREILWFWVTGTPQSAAAELLGLSVSAVKNRWARLRATLAERLSGAGGA